MAGAAMMKAHPMMTLGITGLLSAGSALADNWGPIEVNENFGGLPITQESSILHNQAILSLKNDSEGVVTCDVTFRNGPELPVKRTQKVAPGESGLFTAPLRRKVVKLTVDAQCVPIE